MLKGLNKLKDLCLIKFSEECFLVVFIVLSVCLSLEIDAVLKNLSRNMF